MTFILNGNDYWPNSKSDDNKVEKPVESTKIGTYELPRSLYESLIDHRGCDKDHFCLTDLNSSKTYNYSEFTNMVENFADFLSKKYSVNNASRIGILLYNSIEYCVTIFALSKIGAIAIPLPTKYKESEIESLIDKADLSGIIFHHDFENWFNKNQLKFKLSINADILDGSEPGSVNINNNSSLLDPTITIFTSGTSGKSKGVVLTNQNVMHAIEVYRQIFNITENDKTILAIPGYNVTGLIATLALFVRAGGQIFLKKYFNAKEVLEIVRDNGITFLHGSPTVYKLLLCEKKNFPSLPSLRMFACGSENMPSSKIKELKEWIPSAEFRTVYGLTESSSPATIFPEDASRSKYLGSSGRPVPGLEIKICDDDGNMLSENTVGSIFMRGTNITPGYYKLGTQGFVDGWLDTGDIGYFNEAGYLYIVDRKKDMINRGGEKICSYDIENLINEIHGVKEAAVVGIKDSKYGEVPAAMLATDKNAGLTADMIKDSISKNLAKFQVPVLYEFVKELPKTANMKIDKKAVKKLLEIKTEWRNRNEKT